jgi:hypothetical protein
MRLRIPASVMRSASRRRLPLGPGAVVLVTETVGAHGAHAVSFKSARGTPGGTSGVGSATARGTVVEVGPGALAVQTKDGSTMRFTIAGSLLATLQPSICDTVTVNYHQAGASLLADKVQFNTASALAACDNAGNGGSGGPGQDVVGTVTQMTLTTVTISSSGGGSMTFGAGVELTAGFILGDQVDVTYNPSGGSLLASDINYQSQDAIGTVTAVSTGSVTIVLSDSGQVQTFTDDPTNGTFDGISVGDQIDVTYHLSSGLPSIDSVSDLSTPS